MTNAPEHGFEAHRRHLTRLAYRMLGSISDAEDAVQDAWLRWREADPTAVDNPRAYLTRVVTRLCLDLMKSARRRRELYVGAWLPEPLVEALGASNPADDELDAPIALMLALERLSPLERAAFLLHDIFDMEFAEIARMLDRSETACRQLASRARQHVKIDMPSRNRVSSEEGARYARAFFEAAHRTDASALQALLARDVVLHSDGGGKVPAAINPISGADKVARFFAGIAGKFLRDAQTHYRPARINGLPGYVSLEGGETLQATALDIRDGLIHAIYAVRNPDKLRHVVLQDDRMGCALDLTTECRFPKQPPET
ncbi:MAG TPA: sigma-70 family RNA polymerase sigma factor [Bosea sp. (in: a-proteobacteria)]